MGRTKVYPPIPPPSKRGNIGETIRARVKEAAEAHHQLLEHKIGEKEALGRFLNKNLYLDPALRLSERDRRTAEALLYELLDKYHGNVRKLETKLRDMETLVANLLEGGTRHPISISRKRDTYSEKDPLNIRYGNASYFIISLVKYLFDDGYINKSDGYRGKEESRMTRIWPKQKFTDYFNPFDPPGEEPIELINLKDKNGYLPYVDTDETNRMREAIRSINLVNRNSRVQVKIGRGFRGLNTDLHAVFSFDFTQHGRFYTGRNGYQALRKEERKNIWIDNLPTVELDYGSLHPRLLYALEGIPYDVTKDPYEDIILGYPELRSFAKHLMLALINCKSVGLAKNSGNHYLFKEREMEDAVKAIGSNTEDLIKRFQECHPRIAHYFGKSFGLRLMRLDATIALDVLRTLTSRGIPVLAIHDSFIVQKKWEATLEKAMREAFRKHSGGFECVIKHVY